MKVRQRSAKRRGHARKQGFQRVRLMLVAIIAAATPSIVVVTMIVASTRHDFFYTDFSGFAPDARVRIIGWPALRPSEEAAAIVGTVVELPGYMLPWERANYGEHVDAFLLVPDPGNWLHAPHLHKEDVVTVRMDHGQKVILREREAVWVRGLISISPLENRGMDALYRISASAVRKFD